MAANDRTSCVTSPHALGGDGGLPKVCVCGLSLIVELLASACSRLWALGSGCQEGQTRPLSAPSACGPATEAGPSTCQSLFFGRLLAVPYTHTSFTEEGTVPGE